MEWPTFLCMTLGAFTVVGLVCLALIGWHWGSVGQHVSDLPPKIVTKLIQVPAGAVSIGSAYAAANKQEWLPAALAGAACVITWEVVQNLIDSRVKAADKFSRAELARALREGKYRTRLLSVIRGLVDEKVRRLGRVMRVVRRRQKRPSIAALRTGLTPEPHLQELLFRLAVFLQENLTGAEVGRSNFRVGLYIELDGILKPVYAIDLNNPEYDPFQSYRNHPDFYRLAAQGNTALVVRCVRERQTLIAEDCVEMAGRGEFHYTGEPQRSYLRSMVAFYLGEVCAEDGSMRKAAVVVDSDTPGVFKESDRDSLEWCLGEFGGRLRLEMLLLALLGEGRAQP